MNLYAAFCRPLGDPETHPLVAWYRELRTSNAQMEVVAELFLGMRMACAKCHHQSSNPELFDVHAKYFLDVFGKQEAESACERSVEVNLSQSLHLLNSGDVQN